MSALPYENAVQELSASATDVRPSDVVMFSEPLRSALNFVIRLGRFSLSDFAQRLNFTREEAQRIADILVRRNLFVANSERSTPEEPYYEARLSASSRVAQRKPLDLWNKL